MKRLLVIPIGKDSIIQYEKHPNRIKARMRLRFYPMEAS